ncbi:hypothetical protein [Helicobacter pylori]|nr:hypothetical protein [Helicobacter pylori]
MMCFIFALFVLSNDDAFLSYFNDAFLSYFNDAFLSYFNDAFDLMMRLI